MPLWAYRYWESSQNAPKFEHDGVGAGAVAVHDHAVACHKAQARPGDLPASRLTSQLPDDLDLARLPGFTASDLDDYFPGVLEPFRSGEALWALPDTASPDVLFYDKAAFDAADRDAQLALRGYAVGAVEITVVSDGTVTLDAGAIFGLVPRVMWEPVVGLELDVPLRADEGDEALRVGEALVAEGDDRALGPDVDRVGRQAELIDDLLAAGGERVADRDAPPAGCLVIVERGLCLGSGQAELPGVTHPSRGATTSTVIRASQSCTRSA